MPGAAKHAPGFRADIEGLRAVAVLLVLVYHAGLPVPYGLLGVDVFFVISGYLITGILLRELSSTGTINWPRFAARRVRRLLPAAAVVLVLTALVAWFVVPGLRRQSIGVDVMTAAGYVINWVLAQRAVDYLASDQVPSPLQHFWSLAVEEQFYIVWPLLLIVAAGVLGRVRRRRLTVAHAAGLVAVLSSMSLVFMVVEGVRRPDAIYFVTTTRLWELGAGAALACLPLTSAVVTRLSRHGMLRVMLGWAGLLAIIGSALLLPPGTTWPGPWTLVPVAGAVAILCAGSAGPGGVSRALSVPPMVVIGGLSYSLYLWHWPVLVLSEWIAGPLSLPVKIALCAAAAPAAYASLQWVERPAQHHPWWSRSTRRALVAGAALTVAGVAAGMPLSRAPSVFTAGPPGGVMPPLTTLGAATLSNPPSSDPADYPGVGWVSPNPERAGEDRPKADVDHCQVEPSAIEPVACTFGVPDAKTTIALVGDSKAMQWLPALETVAAAHDWRIITFGKSSCRFGEGRAALGAQAYPACDLWSAAVTQELTRLAPDLVVTSGFAQRGWDGRQATETALIDALTARWVALSRVGIPVLPVLDNPAAPADLDICAARHPHDLSPCAFDREQAIATSGAAADRAAAAQANIAALDLTASLCPTVRCPVVIGHVAVNRAGAHVTATYARTLAPQFETAILAALGN